MENKEITFEELETATKEVVDLLCKKGHPHLSIVITQNSVKVTEDKIGVNIK